MSQAGRRSALGLLAAGAALVTRADPSQAAYGESANIFGKTTNKAGACACTPRSTPVQLLVQCSSDHGLLLPTLNAYTSKNSCACKSGFVPYAGEGYALLVPAKWNPSKEFDFPGVQLR